MSEAAESLKKRGFNVVECASGAEAKKYLLSVIAPDNSVGIGGSVSVEQLGIYEDLTERGNSVYWHWRASGDMNEERKKASASDVYLCSANALLSDGRLINIDGTGNRLGATLWGPGHVYFVIGKNKIVEGSLEDGISRIKNTAGPANAKRLGLSTPCALTGKCSDCTSPQRMCGAVVIIEKNLGSHPITVIMTDEELGY